MMQKIKSKIYNLLRWSQKYTKTDMVYLAEGGFWLTFGQIVSAIASFLLAIAFANLVPKEIYGTYQYALSLMGILTIFTLTGMNTAVTQAVARNFEGTLKKSFWVQMKWNLIMFFASASGAIYYFTQGNKALAITLIIIGIFSPLSNSSNTYTAFLNGKKDFANLTKYGIASNLFSALIVFASILLTKNPLWIIFANIASTTAMNLFFYIKTIKKFNPNNQEDPKAITYGKHLSLMNILSTISSQIDVVLLFHFLGPIQLAIYSFAIVIPERIKGMLKNIMPLSMPKFAAKEMTDIQKTIWRKMFILFLALTGIAIAYILAAPFIFKFLFPKYIEAMRISQIFSLSLVAYSTLPLSSALQAHKKIKYLYLTSNLSSVLQIIFLFVGVYFFGLIGAIIAQVLYRLMSSLFGIIIFKNIYLKI